MRILGLDLGDKWVGVAIADPLGISCKPYQTVERAELVDFLKKVIVVERVSIIVVGRPVTMSGGSSAQTEQIVKEAAELEKVCGTFSNSILTWVLWDERLSSKRAGEVMGKMMKPEEKKRSHAVAAAFILQSYLDFRAQS